MSRLDRGSLVSRLTRGVGWTWTADDYRAALPTDLPTTALDLSPTDRFFAKQGRCTGRIRFDSPWGSLSVYMKRHDRLPMLARIGATIWPRGRFTPASAELAHLDRARRLGVPVPDTVAAGEKIGPWGRLRSFLMVAELTDQLALHEALPQLSERLSPRDFAKLKRELAVELAGIVARLHSAHLFHKDLYLCHVFIDPKLTARVGERLTLIDLHRLAEHRWTSPRWRWKDLGQLLFSTVGVAGLDGRDRLRFWSHYVHAMALRFPRAEARAIRAKAARYLDHNDTR
jgi:heptose I phosphotransferase